MELLFSPRQRAERIIAAGRVLLAALSLFAVWRDPSEPAKYAEIAYGLLVAYLVYALVLALAMRRGVLPGRIYGLATHSFDLAFFSLFMYFTAGPASPFFAYFVFALVCAALRWQWQGTLWTAIASLAAFFTLGYYFSEVIRDPAFELNQFIIRGVYMVVVAILLGHLGRHEQRTRHEISLLASWPSQASAAPEGSLGESLRAIARIHNAPTVAAAWARSAGDATGTSRLELVRGDETRSSTLDLGPDATVAAELANASFLTQGGRRAETLVRARGVLSRWRGAPLSERLRSELGEGKVISARWSGELASGRLFVAGIADPTSDDLLLAEIAAALLGARLDAGLLAERSRAVAAAEERNRLARDLHDGVLQSLTGIGLRVAAARRLLADSPDAARRGLDELQEVVAAEHRDLRFFIQDLEPPAAGEREFDLSRRLAELHQRAEREWGLEISLESPLLDDDLSEPTERDLYFLVRESVANAARHGGARRLWVRLERCAPDRLALLVEDDGRGLEEVGRFEGAELERRRLGPRSLRERVAARGGTLALESSPEGVRIRMEMPV